MKTFVRLFGVASIMLGVAPALAGESQFQGELAGSVPTISKDDDDNSEGDEGGGVIDPIPQDDGSDGVDDGSGH